MKIMHFLTTLLMGAFLVACGGGDSEYIASYYDVYPFSKNAHPELECVMALDVEDSSRHCSLGKLPLIGTVTSNPSAQDIEKRLLVSHDWMGERFMELLDEMPSDIKLMLRSVTGIVIADTIRPSFYTSETGAIYLDPAIFWLTQEERDTISDAPDYRSSFSNGLNFTSFWRYLNADGTWSRAPSYNRKLEDLTFPLARLLYHELAHANTFLPPSTHGDINPQHKVYQAAEAFSELNASVLLETNLPLQSQLLKDLAYVSFRGEAATAEQTALTGLQVGTALASDRANDDYAYVPYPDEIFYEDVAMLLEELMSKYHFNTDREIAYTNASDSIYCNDYLIQWGQTGRIGDVNVKEAARIAVNALIPEADLETFIDNLALPEQTTSGTDWCGPLLLESRPLAKGNDQERGINPLETDISSNFRSPHFH